MAKVITLKQNKRKNKNTIRIMILILTVIIALLLILKSSLFTIKNIDIKGNNHFTDEEICKIVHLDKNKNIFGFILENYFNNKNINPYINNIEIAIRLPNYIKITVEERKLIGYVPYMGTYLCIDKDGCVIDNTSYIPQSYPIIEGLKYNNFTLGQVLKVKNEKTFLVMLQISNAVNKYNLLNKIIKIDITNIDEILIYTKYIEVLFGSIDDYDKKMNVLNQILFKIPNDERGVLSFENMDKYISFKKIN